MNKVNHTVRICFTALMAALMAVGAWIAIPMPWGVSFTLQTLMMALAGYLLGPIYGAVAVVVYVLLGCVGVPVFTGFKSGVAAITGPTGGYIWGFIPMALLCGVAAILFHSFGKKAEGEKTTGITRWVVLVVVSIIALACCHVPGVIQLGKVAGFGYKKAFLLGSASYLAKDLVSMAIAWFVSLAVKRAIKF